MDASRDARSPILPLTLFAAICAAPMALRLQHPSLFSDDVTRIGQLQTSPSLGSLLFVPFNEHMAPLFQTVSWVAWQLCGRGLPRAPLAFVLASLLPHALSLLALGVLVRRELRSATTAMAAVALLGLSGLIVETYAWYSASSFTWSLLGAIVALDCAGRSLAASSRRGRSGWLLASSVASLLAPAGSAIGILAGPLAVIRVVFEPGISPRRRILGLIPALGTLLYLGVCALHRFREVLASSDSSRVDVGLAIRNVATVPSAVLLPGQFGLPNLAGYVPGAALMAATGVLLLACLAWARRSPGNRPAILGGVWLIAGGYALTIGLRSYAGSPMTLINERYQLFPQLGLVLMMAVILRPWLARFDGNARASALAGLAVAVVVLTLQGRALQKISTTYRWDEQAGTLAAMEHLAEVGRDRGITRGQIVAALDPVRKRWFNHEGNALMMLPITTPEPRMPEEQVRSTLLASLSAEQREAIYGGVNVARYLQPSGDPAGTSTVARGRLDRKFEVKPAGPDRWVAGGWASFLEFDLPADARERDEAHRLALKVQGPVEVWWSYGDGKWSEGRSVRWWPSDTEEATEWALPLDRLPHWDRSKPIKMRIIPRRRGPMTAGEPRLLR